MNNQDPIVLIRGLLREQRHWGRFYERLCEQNPERPIVCLDLAGNGCRNHSASPCSIHGMVNDLRVQLRIRDVNPYFIDIIAISMGGMIAIEWVDRYPDEIHSAVLINTSVRPYSPFYQRLNWRQYATILKIFRSPPERQEALILELTSNHPLRHQTILNDWVKWKKQYPISKRNILVQLLAAARFHARYVPARPVLLVASEQDHLVDAACSKVLAARWQLPLTLHPDAGHDLPLDAPDWLCGQIDSFYHS